MIKKNNYYLLTYLLVIGMVSGLFYSCEKEIEDTPKEELNLNNESGLDIDRQIILGKKLENPYSINNMEIALNNLKKSNTHSKTISKELNLEPTHLYVKFTPKNEDELSILKRDSTFILYDYPLDFEIVKNGSYYRDPEVLEGQPTYQYCAIKVTKELPKGIQYEVLAKLFIPDEDKDDENNIKSKKIFSEDITDSLVDEALRITNNVENKKEKTQEQNLVLARRRKWRPAGTIRVWDTNLLRWIGVEGVEVRARKWFTTHKGIANSSGYYSCDGRFRGKANYSIDWERYHFALQDGWLNGATNNGPKKRGNWDLNLNSGKQQYYATIFRAAYHYYYKDIKGLRRPPQNSFWRTQLKIRAYNEENSEIGGSHKEERRFLGAQIKIYNPQNSSRSIYATTIHELAHASHWNLWRSNGFDDTESIVKESWARGVEWELTNMVYSGYNPSYSRLRYTGVVEDLIDGFKTRNSFRFWTEQNPWSSQFRSYEDKVKGYTIKQLEDALKGQKTWVNWQNNIINTLNNETSHEVQNNFNFWNIQ